MKTKDLFQVGDTVFLKSDVSGNFPMTILEVAEYSYENSHGYDVCWLTRTGRMLYNRFPGAALRSGNL